MVYAALWLVVVYLLTRSHYTIWRSDTKKYLTRVYIVGQWFRKLFHCRPYLHIFHASDDAEYHNHRWKWGYSLILWRGYTEWRRTPMEMFYLGQSQGKSFKFGWGETVHEHGFLSINKLDNEIMHRVELKDDKPCVTLFIAGPFAEEDWGFLREDGTIEYARDRFTGRRDDLSDD